MYCASCGHSLQPSAEGGFACVNDACALRGARQEGMRDGETIRTPFPFPDAENDPDDRTKPGG